MFRPDNYTSEVLRLAKTVSVLNEERGIFQCDGFAAQVTEEFLPWCECDDFKADGECIHLDAIGYVLDHGALNVEGAAPVVTVREDHLYRCNCQEFKVNGFCPHLVIAFLVLHPQPLAVPPTSCGTYSVAIAA